jgi:DNA ligase-1
MSEILFSKLARLGEQLEGTTKRLELAELLAEFIRTLAPPEIPPAVRLIIGQVFPESEGKALNLSWSAVMEVIDELTAPQPTVSSEIRSQAVDGGEAVRMLFERARLTPPQTPPPTLLEVFQTLEQIAETAGKGSRARKAVLLRGLLERSTPIEAKYLTKVILQEMRHGVNEGILLDGIARAAGIQVKHIRRANQLWGDIGEVALAAMAGGKQALQQASIRVFRPIKPMLAQTAEDLAAAFEAWPGRLALEYKLDGARVQIHVRGDRVCIYSRQLNEVTDSLPDVAAEILDKLSAREAVLEGEALAVDAQGRPLPFQHLMRRFQRKYDIAETIREVPVQLYLFDALYVDGRSLIDVPNRDRWRALK